MASSLFELKHPRLPRWLSGKKKNLAAVQEMWIQSLGREDLEEEMATHCSVLAWRIPWTEGPACLHPWNLERVRHNLATEQQEYAQY